MELCKNRSENFPSNRCFRFKEEVYRRRTFLVDHFAHVLTVRIVAWISTRHFSPSASASMIRDIREADFPDLDFVGVDPSCSGLEG